MDLRQNKFDRVLIPKAGLTVSLMLAGCCWWWLLPAAQAQPRQERSTDNPVVFSVDNSAEGLSQPDAVHLSPNDVFGLGPAGGWGYITDGELFQASGGSLGVGPDQTNVDRMSAALGIGTTPGLVSCVGTPPPPPPYMGPFTPSVHPLAGTPCPAPPGGLLGTLGLTVGDNIDALSFGRDGGSVLLFSVDPSSTGMPGTAVNWESTSSPTAACVGATPSNGGGDPGEEAAGDIFVSAWIGGAFGGGMNLGPLFPQPLSMNGLWLDELDLGLQAPALLCAVNSMSEDDLDALEVSDATEVDADLDGVPDGGGAFVFFSLSATSSTILVGTPDPYPGLCTAADPDGVTPDDILISPPPGVPTPPFAFAIYASGVLDVGLQNGDVIDALVLYDTDGAGGVPDGILTPGQDTALYSLKAGSPSLSPPLYGSDVLLTTFDGIFPPTAGFSYVWLGLTAADELNALDIGWWFPPEDHPGGKNREKFTKSLGKITVDATGEGMGMEAIRLEGPVDIVVDLTTLADADTNGLEEVSTEMTGLDLTGNSLLWGSVDVTLNPAYYTDGKIEETVNNIRGVLEIPPFTSGGTATSFFDVYYEIEVAGETFHNPTPAHMANPGISHKRPRPRDPAYKDPYLIPVNRPGGVPTMIYIGDESHHPEPPPPDPHGAGPSWIDFGDLENPPIPADFFFPGSDPWTGHIELYGDFINITFGDAGTVFQRWGVPIGPDADVPTNGTVDLEIIELDLVSTMPITVTSNGVDHGEWNVAVNLSDAQALLPFGALTATKTHENGGTFDTWLEVQPKLTFTKVGEPEEQIVWDTGDGEIEERPPLVFESMLTPWVHEVNPDLDILAPNDGYFVPMVEQPDPMDITSQYSVEMIATSGVVAHHTMRPAMPRCIYREEFASFVSCLDQGGPGAPVPDGCDYWDLNGSGHVDLGDFALIQEYICAPPPGDDCEDPIVIELPAQLGHGEGNTTCEHGNDYTDTCLDLFDDGEDLIYELNVTDPVDVNITLDPHGFPDTGIAIGYEGECPPGDPCLEYSIGDATGMPHGIECVHLDPGVYYLMVDSADPPGCYDFDLNIEECPQAPPNDLCAGATVVSCGDGLFGEDLTEANNDYDPLSGGCTGFPEVGPDITYSLTLMQDTPGVTIDMTNNPAFDAALYVVTDCDDVPGTCVVGSDVCCIGAAEQVMFDATADVTYYIIADAWTGEGTFDLTIEECVSPTNDDCASAEPIGDVLNHPFDTTYATVDGPGMCMSGPNIWYCYEPSFPGLVTVSLCGSSYDTVLGVFHTCSCDPVGPIIGCNDNFCGSQSQVEFMGDVGETYLIEVGGNGSNTGEGMLTVSCE